MFTKKVKKGEYQSEPAEEPQKQGPIPAADPNPKAGIQAERRTSTTNIIRCQCCNGYLKDGASKCELCGAQVRIVYKCLYCCNYTVDPKTLKCENKMCKKMNETYKNKINKSCKKCKKMLSDFKNDYCNSCI